MRKIQNPHDIFTKIMLSDPEAAQVFLRLFWPADLSDKLDFSTLKQVDQTFISEDMMEATGNLQTTYFAYLFDLFKDQKEITMQKFEETIWPTEDRTKNYILQLI